MDAIAELKQLIEKDNKLTKELQEKFAGLSDDYVAKDEYKRLETAVAENATARSTAESKLAAMQTQVEELKRIAEEAATKAGRFSAGNGGDPDELVEHKDAFNHFLRNRNDYDAQKALKEAEQKAFQTTVPGDGGFAVPEVISREIQKKIADEAVMRNLVKVVQVGTSDYRELVNKGGAGFAWIGETGTRTTSATSSIYEVAPPMGTIYAYPEATEESLDDVFFDIEGLVIDDSVVAFSNGTDIAIISGDGTNKPLGLFGTAPVATADGARADKVLQYLPTGVAGDFSADGHADIINLIYAVKARYRARASFCMNSLSTAKVRILKDGNGRPLWHDNQIVGQPPTLEGYAVNAAESMPDFAADALPIMFGDYRSAYTLVERHLLRVTKDEITKPGYVRWHIRRRTGGAVTNDDAVKVLKASLT